MGLKTRYLAHKNYTFTPSHRYYDIAMLILEGSGIQGVAKEDFPMINDLSLKTFF